METPVRRLAAAALPALLAAIVACAPAAASRAVPLGANGKPIASAGLEACVTSVNQLERSATFVSEMTAVPGTVRMQMRVEMLERPQGAAHFHAISYPGLGQWLRSSPGVKTYRNFSKVTDLYAPATYRALVHYRWLGSRGRLIRTLELRTARCEQPAPPPREPLPPVAGA
jgi:hypothetical protein